MAVWIPKNAIRLCSKPASAASLNHGIQVCDYSDKPTIIKNPTVASLKRGTGGRSSFSGHVCTVFGASGFVGRYVCNRLGKIGSQLIVPYRGEHYEVKRLKLCGDLGQVLFHPFELYDEDSIYRSVKYSNVVINLIGRDYETKNFSFDDVNVKGAETIARISKECGVERLIHLSCLGANANPQPKVIPGGSKFLKSKWEGEELVRKIFPEATIVRPAVIYGQEDRFLNNYIPKIRLRQKKLPMWKKGEETIKQPIHVGDVAAGITAIVKDPRTAGKTYQFLGPDKFTMADLVDWFRNLLEIDAPFYGYARTDIEMDPLFKLRVSLAESMTLSTPVFNLHWEAIEIDSTSDESKEGIPTLEDLGISPARMAERVYWELRPYRTDINIIDAIPEKELPKPPQPVV